jgi:hypothetical protein
MWHRTNSVGAVGEDTKKDPDCAVSSVYFKNCLVGASAFASTQVLMIGG